MSQPQDISREAGRRFSGAGGFSFEDAQLLHLRYHLLRLTVIGVTQEDVTDLAELGRLAFQESDVAQQVAKIKQRSDASPLAFAIADIVEQAGSGIGGVPAGPRAVMWGAVLGAYTGLGEEQPNRQLDAAVLGAIGGAVAVSTSTFVAERVDQQAWAEYLRTEDA
jgi:hypothetical protein